MLFQAYSIILLGVGFVSSDIRNDKRCGWLYGNACKYDYVRINVNNMAMYAN